MYFSYDLLRGNPRLQMEFYSEVGGIRAKRLYPRGGCACGSVVGEDAVVPYRSGQGGWLLKSPGCCPRILSI